MKIENKYYAKRIKLIFLAIPFIFVIIAVPLFILNIPNSFYIILALGVIAISIIIYLNIVNYNYLNISINEKLIIIKFFGLAPLNKEYKAFKIKTENFVDYKIEYKLWGRKKTIYIYAYENGDIYKYPGFNTNALNQTDYNKLIKSLELLKLLNIKK